MEKVVMTVNTLSPSMGIWRFKLFLLLSFSVKAYSMQLVLIWIILLLFKDFWNLFYLFVWHGFLNYLLCLRFV